MKIHFLWHWSDLYAVCGRAPSVKYVTTKRNLTTCWFCLAAVAK